MSLGSGAGIRIRSVTNFFRRIVDGCLNFDGALFFILSLTFKPIKLVVMEYDMKNHRCLNAVNQPSLML